MALIKRESQELNGTHLREGARCQLASLKLLLFLLLAAVVFTGGYFGLRCWVRGHSEATVRKAHRLLVAGGSDSVIPALSRILWFEPKRSDALLAMGLCRQAQGDYPAAIVCFESIPSTAPEHRRAESAAAFSALAIADVESAERLFAQHLRRYPDAVSARYELRWLYFNLFQSRDAERLLYERLELQPENPDVLRDLLLTEFRGPVAREGLAYLQALEQRRPGQVPVLRGLGYCLWQLGELEAAHASFRAALERAPEDRETLMIFGEFLLEQGHPELVSDQLSRLSDVKPLRDESHVVEDDRILWLRARLAELSGDAQQALTAIDRALEIRPYELKYVHRRGILLQKLGRLDEAAEILQKSNELSDRYMRLSEIAWSGELGHPDVELLTEIAGIYRLSGRAFIADCWENWARRLESEAVAAMGR